MSANESELICQQIRALGNKADRLEVVANGRVVSTSSLPRERTDVALSVLVRDALRTATMKQGTVRVA